MSNHPKLQHYVPQFLLREFAFGKKHQLYAYDKRTDRILVTNVKNAAAEGGFYDLEERGVAISLEAGMGSIETKVAPLLKRIVRDASLGWMSNEDRAAVSYFVALQLTRTRRFRNRIGNGQQEFVNWLRRLGYDPTLIPGFSEPGEDSSARVQTRIALTAHEIAPLIAEKTWVLLSNQTSRPFYTSDNPVAFQNHQAKGPGSIGLGVPGIEVNLPLSKRLVLAMLCTSYEENIRTAVSRTGLLRRAGMLPPEHEPGARQLQDFVERVERGDVVEQSPENVINVNSLQVGYSDRYVYSSTDSFELVKEMLCSDPRLRDPEPRPGAS